MSQSAVSRSPHASMLVGVSLVLATWVLAALGASVSGAFVTRAGIPPWPLLLAVTVPPVVFGFLYRFVPAVRSFVLALDLRWLVPAHSWRFFGVSFLFFSAYGVLPLTFSVPAGVGDGLVAIGAVIVGTALMSPAGASRRAVMVWNTSPGPGVPDLRPKMRL